MDEKSSDGGRLRGRRGAAFGGEREKQCVDSFYESHRRRRRRKKWDMRGGGEDIRDPLPSLPLFLRRLSWEEKVGPAYKKWSNRGY